MKIRARVQRALYHPFWFAHARATDSETGAIVAMRSSDPQHSHPEAMQAAYKLLADLDAELMTEVHASRASRRTDKETIA